MADSKSSDTGKGAEKSTVKTVTKCSDPEPQEVVEKVVEAKPKTEVRAKPPAPKPPEDRTQGAKQVKVRATESFDWRYGCLRVRMEKGEEKVLPVEPANRLREMGRVV